MILCVHIFILDGKDREKGGEKKIELYFNDWILEFKIRGSRQQSGCKEC